METAYSAIPNAVQTHGRTNANLSDDDDDLPDGARSAEFLSSVEDLPEQHRAQEAHGYAGRFDGRLSSPRFLRPFFSLTNRSSRRNWSRIPNSDTPPDTDLSSDEGHTASKKSHGSTIGALKEMLFASWLNALLVFVPIGLVTYIFRMNPILVFMTNVIAIIPLSALLTEATEKIAKDAGDTIGALLNISLGNLVELILFVALVNGHIRIVQASILGSILVNLLLILGSALLASSFRNFETVYNTAETQLLSCLLFVSVFVFMIPTAFDYTYDHKGAEGAILKMSRISAIMVLVIYLLYFVHELRTRKSKSTNVSTATSSAGDYDLENIPPPPMEQIRTQTGEPQPLPPRTIRFADENHNPDASPELLKHNDPDNFAAAYGASNTGAGAESQVHPGQDHGNSGARANAYQSANRTIRPSRSGSLSSLRGGLSLETSVMSAERIGMMRSGLTNILRETRTSMDSVAHFEHPAPTRSTGDRVVSIIILILTSALMSMCAEFLVSTIDDVTHQGHLSESLIGLIILPIVGNIAEYVTVVTVAARDKLDLAIAVAVGSSIQIALCVTPLTIIAGWILDRNLALTFDFFEIATLLGTVLLVNLLILNDAGGNSSTNGLRGALVVSCYVIIGLGAYLSPTGEP
ncbi:Vacuolar calcium ion transporter [Paramyrothecium foliicola]|nr:Vacuolar calcium ion transporter [Paramyrothecium foliicola]